MTIDLKYVVKAVVVKICKRNSPTNVLRVDAESCPHHHVFEDTLAGIAEEVRIVTCKACLDEVQPAVAIEVTHPNPHAALSEAELTESATGPTCNILDG